MPEFIKLRKGLDIHLEGTPQKQLLKASKCGKFALVPDGFQGISPKVLVKEGDIVKAGEILFVDKRYPEVGFSSPVSGIVSEIVRGERRKLIHVLIDADEILSFKQFKPIDVDKASGEQIIDTLLEAGLFGYINQLPYAISTNPQSKPKAIFVSTFRDMPLANDFEHELEGNEQDFQAALTALSKIAPVYLGIKNGTKQKALVEAKDVEINIFEGPCPAGNVGVQINNTLKINKGEVIWTINPTSLIFFGRLFNYGKVDLRKTIAIAGTNATETGYMEVMVGQSLHSILDGRISEERTSRIINGNPLTGVKSSIDGYLLPHTSEITILPEGNNVDEMLGWIMPRTNQMSTNRSYFSWLMPRKSYNLDTRIKGGERKMIMSGEYDKVLPMDIFAEYLIKAIIAGDIDKMEQLGIYEVAPEDFALAEFVDSSKLELQKIVRDGLDMLRKENM